jgi:hypothetical protein
VSGGRGVTGLTDSALPPYTGGGANGAAPLAVPEPCEAPPAAALAAGSAIPLLFSLEEWIKEATLEVPWLFENFLAPGHFTVLCAAPKIGKTTLLTNYYAAALQGREFLGRKARRPSQLIIFTEERQTLQRSFLRLGITSSPADCPVQVNSRLPDWRSIISIARGARPDALIVLDTGSGFWGLEDENESSKVRSALNPLIEAAQAQQLSLLFVHHMNKSGEVVESANVLGKVRGSSAIAGAADIVVLMGRPSSKSLGARRRIEIAGRVEHCRLDVTYENGRYVLETDDDYDPDDPSGVGRPPRESARTGAKRGPPPDKRQSAKGFLERCLAGGRRTRRDVIDGAEAEGIKEGTLKNAARDLDVSFGAGGWSLPRKASGKD